MRIARLGMQLRSPREDVVSRSSTYAKKPYCICTLALGNPKTPVYSRNTISPTRFCFDSLAGRDTRLFYRPTRSGSHARDLETVRTCDLPPGHADAPMIVGKRHVGFGAPSVASAARVSFEPIMLWTADHRPLLAVFHVRRGDSSTVWWRMGSIGGSVGTRKPQYAWVFVEHDFSDAIVFRLPRGPWHKAVFPADAFRITRARFGNASDVRCASRPRGGAQDRGETPCRFRSSVGCERSAGEFRTYYAVDGRSPTVSGRISCSPWRFFNRLASVQ